MRARRSQPCRPKPGAVVPSPPSAGPTGPRTTALEDILTAVQVLALRVHTGLGPRAGGLGVPAVPSRTLWCPGLWPSVHLDSMGSEAVSQAVHRHARMLRTHAGDSGVPWYHCVLQGDEVWGAAPSYLRCGNLSSSRIPDRADGKEFSWDKTPEERARRLRD